MRCGGCATQPARHPCLCHSAAHSPAPFHIRPVPRTPAPCSLHHVTYTYNPQPSSAAHVAWSADAARALPSRRIGFVTAVCCSHRVQLKTAIHAMYGYVDGIKIDVADCRECVRAAAPRRAAQCTAIGLNRCCGVQLRLRAAGRSPMRGGRRFCGRSGSATAPTRCRRGRGRTRPVDALRCGRGEPRTGADGCADGLARLGHRRELVGHGASVRLMRRQRGSTKTRGATPQTIGTKASMRWAYIE